MSPEEIQRIAQAVMSSGVVTGFALVLGVGEDTVVLLHNCCAKQAGDMLHDAAKDISRAPPKGGQRPALFN
jgi:hypothetical protein